MPHASAQMGFKCSKQKVEIHRKQNTLVIIQTENQSEQQNAHLILPIENTVDAFQARHGIYQELIATAQAHFPYMPEGLMVAHIMRSTQQFRKGIQALENGKEPVSLSNLYCKTLI